jgi:Spy/CpxP family protein refolding chaperone
MKTKLVFVTVLAFAAAIAALAEAGHQPPSPAEMAAHHVKKLTTLLNLTSAQQQQATTIYTNAATSERSLHANGKQSHQAMQAAVKSNDTATIDQLSNSMAQSIAQSMSTRAKADAAFYQILTPDQQTKFTDLESQHMLGGPGGPGGRMH